MLALQLILAIQITGGTYTTDFLSCLEQGICDPASDHIDFITIGNSDDHVSILPACFLQNVRVGSLARNGAYIDAVL